MGLLPQPLSACLEPEGILLTLPAAGGLQLSVWVKPSPNGAFLTDALGEFVLPVPRHKLSEWLRPVR